MERTVEKTSTTQLAAENALRRAKIDRLIKAKIDEDASAPAAIKKQKKVSATLVPGSETRRKHS